MWELILGSLLLLTGVIGCMISNGLRSRNSEVPAKLTGFVLSGIFCIIGLFLLLDVSFTTVGSDEVGHLRRVYFGSSMPTGQVVALKGQNGPQAETLSPGWHFPVFEGSLQG